MAKRMKSGYTVNEIQDIIQTAIDTANDDKGYGVEGALDDLYSLVEDLDEHQRFPAFSSHAYKHGYLERPIVDEWMHILGQVIKRQWPKVPLCKHEYQTIVTCDVDHPFEYTGKVKKVTTNKL